MIPDIGSNSKHPGPGEAWTADIRSAQAAESDFLVSQGESDFPGSDTG